MMDEHHEVAIVGAGIAGLATAVALKRVGVESLVLERAQELCAAGAAISLFPNAWRALEAHGVAHKLDPLYQSFDISRVTNLTTGFTQDINFSTGSGWEMCGDWFANANFIGCCPIGTLPD